MYLRARTCFASVILASLAVPVLAQQPAQRVVASLVDNELHTRIERLLASPDTLLQTDYYHIDMRFGPNVRLDAVIVTALDSAARMQGLRVQVRDQDKAKQFEATTYLDLDEVERFSRAISVIADVGGKWSVHDERRATDLSFTSNGGLRLSLYQSDYQSGRIQRATLSTGVNDPVTTQIELPELPTLKHAVDEALAWLKAK